jgi:crotonobetaine/carnitine-CoA ligase
MVDIPLEERIVARLLRRAVERHPDRLFCRFKEVGHSYAEFNELACKVANGLTGLGLEKGGKLAIMLQNSPEFLYAWMGAAKAGIVYVPINTDYLGEVLRHQLHTADVTHILIGPQFAPRLEAIMQDLPKLRHVILVDPDVAPASARAKIAFSHFQELLQASGSEPDVRLSYMEPHAISFTSGTTGPSKGVLASNCHVSTFAIDWTRANRFAEGSSIYTPLPLFHAIASWLGVVPTMIAGGTITIAERFSASRYWDEVRQANADVAHGVFAMVPILLKQPPREDDALQPARIFYTGRRDEAFERRFNCRVIEVFGSTETGIVTLPPDDDAKRPDSCGTVNSDSFEVMIAGPDDQPVPVGEAGEILVRPRRPFAMFTEYYGMPDATLAAFRNQWFHTGDIARCDREGYLFFMDRKKDVIRRRGENISSFDLEMAVARHPGVLECAAIAVKSELSEEDVKIVVVPQPGQSLTAEELWQYCEQNMPRFWVPRYIEFRDRLPKTPNQKVQKFALREAGALGRLHDRGSHAGGASEKRS